MNRKRKPGSSTKQSFRPVMARMMLQCLIASLIFNLANGAAIVSGASLHPTAIRHSSRIPQFVSQELGLLAEGQVLMGQQTKQAVTQALARFKEAVALSQKKGNKLGLGAARFLEGVAYDWLGKPRDALNAFLDASRYLDEGGIGLFVNPIMYAVIGTTYASLGETDKALDYLNRALPSLRLKGIPEIFLEALGYPKEQFLAYALKGLGDAHMQIGQKRKALEYLSEALDLYQKIGDWLHEVLALSLMSALRSSLGQPTEAIKSAQAAIDRSKEKKSLDWEAYGNFALGAAYSAVGNLDHAAAAYNHALELLRGQNDLTGEAAMLNNLGLIYVARGDFTRALDHFERAMKLAKSSNEPRLAAYAANNIGVIYSRRGNPVEAFRYFKEALDFAASNKERRLEAAVLTSMAESYFLINGGQYALKLLEKTAATFREIEEPAYESGALFNLADVYASMGRYKEALDVLNMILESRRLAADLSRQGYVLREMGGIYTKFGDRDKASIHFAEALSKFEAAGDDIGKVEVYIGWGAVCIANRDYQKAEELFTKGLALARKNGLRQSESLILAAFGYLRENQGRIAEAENFYDQHIAVSESLHSSARIEEIKTGMSNIFAPLLSPAILLKLRLGKSSEAFELTEKVRARTFLDQMNNARIDIRQDADPELANQEQSVRFDIRLLEEKLEKEQRNNPSSEACRLMRASLKEKEEAYAALLIRLKASNPGYAQLQSYPAVSLNEIQKLLGPQTTMVSYYVATNKTLAFVIGSDSFHAVEIPVKQTDLRAEIDWFRSFASLRDPSPQSLKQLDSWLVAPLRSHIKTSEVIIVPHGILHYVPFAALTDGRRYFGDDHTIYHLPSASTLPALRRRTRRDGRRVLSLAQSHARGLPSLRHVDEEASSLAKMYNTQPLLTGRATRAEFLKRAGDYDILHIAAHAELNATSPLFSRIRLASAGDDNGAIEVREIYGMNMDGTSMVVLSACETLLGEHSKGDEIVGLNRAFIYAGASSVIASLWRVEDEATSLLMKTFYSHLKRGWSKAAALQAAQTATRKKYPHPYYWAGFVLTGDPGKRFR